MEYKFHSDHNFLIDTIEMEDSINGSVATMHNLDSDHPAIPVHQVGYYFQGHSYIKLGSYGNRTKMLLPQDFDVEIWFKVRSEDSQIMT